MNKGGYMRYILLLLLLTGCATSAYEACEDADDFNRCYARESEARERRARAFVFMGQSMQNSTRTTNCTSRPGFGGTVETVCR